LENRLAHSSSWGVVVGTRADIAYAPQRRLFWLLTAGTLVTALAAGMLSISITRRATRNLVAEIERGKEVETELAQATSPSKPPG
jgi:hypothetical protein